MWFNHPRKRIHHGRRTAAARHAAEAGFNLLEILIVLAILGLLATFTWPLTTRYIKQFRMEGRMHAVAALLQEAKGAAVQRGVPVVVKVVPDTEELLAFADVNDDAGDPLSDLLFNPDDGLDPFTGQPKTRGATDYEVRRLLIGVNSNAQARVYLWDVGEATPWTNAVDGFTTDPTAGEQPNIIVFEPDGSVRDVGALRFGMGPLDYDGSGGTRHNFLEVRVAPRSTARIEIRKFVPEPAGVADYYASDATPEGVPWRWY